MELKYKVKGKGTTKHCAYGTCKSDSRYPDRSGMENVFFLRFPQLKRDQEKCIRWANACSRKDFDASNVKKDTYICSLHFVGGNGPTYDHPDPMPVNATKYDIARISKTPRRKILRDVQPFTPSLKSKSIKLDSFEAAEILLSLSNQEEKENINEVSATFNKRQCVSGIHTYEHNTEIESYFFTASKMQEASTQTTSVASTDITLRIQNKILENENKTLMVELESLKCNSKTNGSSGYQLQQLSVKGSCSNQVRYFTVSDIEKDDRKCKFFTGLTSLRFIQLFNFLAPAVGHITYWNRRSQSEFFVEPKDALLMVLMRLRGGYTQTDLAYRFGVSDSTVSKVVLTWIQFMYKQFLPLKEIMFCERGKLKESVPMCFKKYKNIRCIIDCTDFFCQRPGNFHRQGNLYSSYKSHTTYKVLVAVAPNGTIIFTSNVFEGSISDRDITIESGFLELLNPGDTVMADRGFNIKDLLNERKVDLIIPPFLAGRKIFTPQEEALTKDIAKHRIHVERAIERMKKFKLL